MTALTLEYFPYGLLLKSTLNSLYAFNIKVCKTNNLVQI